jgi:hypothetical protein
MILSYFLCFGAMKSGEDNNLNKLTLTTILVLVVTFFSACQSSSKEKAPFKPTLLFKSGFEDNVYIDETAYSDSEDYRYIRGEDLQSKFNWPINILGANDSALHYIDDDEHHAVMSQIQTVVGHDGTLTKALYSIENYNLGVTQCPYEILNIQDGESDLYVKYWIKMDSSSLVQPDMWRAIFEYKTKDYQENEGFRLIAFIYTDDDGIPYWHFQGDRNPQEPIWEIDNKKVAVPLDEWFLTEFYWHWSEGDDGKVIWKINGETIAKHHGATTRNSKPIDFIILTQIYGDANPKYQWVDDIEIWDAIPTN